MVHHYSLPTVGFCWNGTCPLPPVGHWALLLLNSVWCLWLLSTDSDASGNGVRWSGNGVISEITNSSCISGYFSYFTFSGLSLAWEWRTSLPAFLSLQASSILGSSKSSWGFFIVSPFSSNFTSLGRGTDTHTSDQFFSSSFFRNIQVFNHTFTLALCLGDLAKQGFLQTLFFPKFRLSYSNIFHLWAVSAYNLQKSTIEAQLDKHTIDEIKMEPSTDGAKTEFHCCSGLLISFMPC